MSRQHVCQLGSTNSGRKGHRCAGSAGQHLDILDEVDGLLVADDVPQAVSGHDERLILHAQDLLMQVGRCHHVPATHQQQSVASKDLSRPCAAAACCAILHGAGRAGACRLVLLTQWQRWHAVQPRPQQAQEFALFEEAVPKGARHSQHAPHAPGAGPDHDAPRILDACALVRAIRLVVL